MPDELTCEVPYLAVRFPEACACCRGRADGTTTMGVTRPQMQRGMDATVPAESVQVPFCKACAAHGTKQGGGWLPSLLVGGGVAGLLIGKSGPILPGRTAGIALAGVVIALVLRMFLGARKLGCAKSASAVACMGPLPSKRYRFYFSNARYGRAFIALNAQGS